MAEKQMFVVCEGYKEPNARENALITLSGLFEIILDYSTNTAKASPKQVFVFFFVLCFYFLRLLQLQGPHSSYFQFKQRLKSSSKQVCIYLSHRNRIIQIVLCKSSLDFETV